jgi:hypothetical protein
MKTLLRGIGLAIVLLTVSFGPARGIECQGTCTVYCESGSYVYYNVTARRCCDQRFTTCPAGMGMQEGADWWPTSCGMALVC